MKLIRLTTDIKRSSRCEFNNDFQDNLVLKPQSTMALLNVSIDTIDVELIIDSTNDTIEWTIKDTYNVVTSPLIHATYNKTNFNTLITDITNKLNQSVEYLEGVDGWEGYVGVEWECSIVNNRVNIEYKRGELLEYAELLTYYEEVIEFQDEPINDAGGDTGETTPSIAIYGTPDLSTPDFENNVAILPAFLARGLGTIRTQIYKLERDAGQNLASNGFVIGISTTDFSKIDPVDFTESMITYGLKVSLTNAGDPRYVTYLDGEATTVTAGTLTPIYDGEGFATNDFLDVSVNGGSIVISVYGGTGQTVLEAYTLESQGFSQSQKFYPFIGFNTGSDFTKANELNMTASPFQDLSGLTTESYNMLGMVGDPPEPPIGALGNSKLIFKEGNGNRGRLWAFLGYNFPTVVGGVQVDTFNFIAPTIIQAGGLPNSFIVELQNIQLDAYDAVKGGRKNILYFISGNNDDGGLHFEVNSPIFIDLNNKNEILLRNIRARILDSDYSELLILNNAFMTVIVN